jgi:serine/threonine protein kinase
MADLLERSVRLSKGLLEAGAALPRMKKMQKGVLDEIETFSANEKALREEIYDIKLVIQEMQNGNGKGLTYLNKAHYVYVRDLGRGGMGKAQLYYYTPQDAWVVVKTILPEYQQDPELIERFRREATIAKELQHPNLARGFGYGGDEFAEEEFAVSDRPSISIPDVPIELEKSLPPAELQALVQTIASITDRVKIGIFVLCKMIERDKYDWLPHSPNNTIERLNELLTTADFYDTGWVVRKPDVRLSQEALRLIDKTNGYRNKAFADLGEIERSNIVRLNRLLLEAGYSGACPRSRLYSVTEFIRGRSLDDVLYTKKPSPQNPEEQVIESAHKMSAVKAARMALRLVDAQGYTAGRGIIHRDLKPENIMIDADGNPKEIDFGIARQVGDLDRMTRTATLMGTQIYMAPEQLRGERELTDKVDIYALGEIIYEALVGNVLFPFSNPPELINAKFNPGYASEVIENSEDVPPALKEILIRMVAIEKENRPSHDEIYTAFEQFLATQEGTAVG